MIISLVHLLLVDELTYKFQTQTVWSHRLLVTVFKRMLVNDIFMILVLVEIRHKSVHHERLPRISST